MDTFNGQKPKIRKENFYTLIEKLIMANENAKICFVSDSRLSRIFGNDADPRNGIAHRLTEICPIQAVTFAAGGQRMSRYPWPSSLGESLSFVDSKSSLQYIDGLYDDLKAIVIMLDYNDWLGGDSNSLTKYLRAYNEVLNYFEDMNNNPVVMTSGFITIDEENTTNDGGFYLQDFRDAQEDLAAERGKLFIPGESLLPQDQDYFYDSRHLNNLGSYTAATNWATALQTANILPANYY